MGLRATAQQHGTGVWVSGAINTDPADGTVLADTGALDGGAYLFAVTVATTVSVKVVVQHRNAANSANNDAQNRYVYVTSGSNGANDDWPLPNKMTVAASERLRVVTDGAVTGTVQASIFHMEVAP